MNKYIKPLLVIFIALFLNIIWEFLHYHLYNDLSGIPANLHLIEASFFDMLIIFLILLIISLKNRGIKWLNKPSFSDYLIIVILGLVIAGGIETLALGIGRWEYKEIMPTIFGLGVSPLIQIFVTGILALLIARFFLSISKQKF